MVSPVRPAQFSIETNSFLQQQTPAEVQGANMETKAEGSNPCDNSVAHSPSFDSSFDPKTFHLTEAQIKCPVVVEIFCGSARLTASLKVLGLSSSFGVDHKVDKAISSAKELDLTKHEHQQTLFYWLRSPLVVGAFLSPPCGTCSLARKIQLRDSNGRPIAGPRPLRSSACPEGLPNLTAAERARVSSANRLYELVAKIVSFANDHGLIVVV